MITEKQYDLIDAFVRCKMSLQTKERFQKEIDQNPELQLAVEEALLTQTAIGSRQLSKELQTWHHEIVNTKNQSGTGKLKFLITIAVAAAVSSLILILQDNSKDYENLYDTYYFEDPGLPTLMSSNTTHFLFSEGMVSYKLKNYDKAIDYWEQIKALQPSSDTLEFYLAMAHLGKNNYEEARQILSNEELQKKSAFKNETFFYLGLMSLREGKPDLAKSYLKQSGLKQARDLADKLNNE